MTHALSSFSGPYMAPLFNVSVCAAGMRSKVMKGLTSPANERATLFA